MPVGSRLVPVFPLPEAVFFPGTALPLLVFEERYRAMVRDARDGDGLIAVALLTPGFENDYAGTPDFHEIATLGRIDELEELPDGRFKIQLVGLERVALTRMPTDKPYQIARAEVRPERRLDPADPALPEARLELLAARGLLMQELAEEGEECVAFDDDASFDALLNGACATLPVEGVLRQALLEEDDPLERQRRLTGLIQEVLETIHRLKTLRGKSRDEGGLN